MLPIQSVLYEMLPILCAVAYIGGGGAIGVKYPP